MKIRSIIFTWTAAVVLSGCASAGNVLNPFYEAPKPEALLGERTDRALLNEADKMDSARASLEKLSTYRRAQEPEPANPVMQPAVVRIMWVPDHVNSHGDLVPDHYYYIKVLKERWAVQDSFELEKQLQGPGASAGSNLPYVYEDDVRRRQ